MDQKFGCTAAMIGGGLLLLLLFMLAYPQYRVYSQRLSGEAALAEAEVIRARGAARANAILQNSLGGPEGYLRYLQIQALESTHGQLIYVPTEAGLPVTESRRLQTTSSTEK